MIIRDTYNGNEILRKYNKKDDTYKIVYIYVYVRANTHTHGIL